MRDPRLGTPSSSSPTTSSARPPHQDVLPPSPISPSFQAHGSYPMPAGYPYYGVQPQPHQHRPVESFLSQAPYYQGHLRPSSSRPDLRYVHQQPHHQQAYYWDQRGQAYVAVPVEEQPHHAPQLPPPVQAPAPQPVHRVYTLRCASCDTFLSDRGMRAVLLLKPHIVLFSTDARPANTDTFFPDVEEEEHVERTCECLTSSINCLGCGKTVGYNIVSPCVKCNASVAKHSRSANHHRYVFHHNEVVARERTYYPGEKGVLNPIVPRPTSPSSSRGPSPTPTPAVADGEKDETRLSASRRRAARVSRSPTPGAAGGRGQGTTLLKAGQTLYWHHLVAGGERAKPVDPRSREPIWVERDGR
ncbi:hypothetical protein JCM8097_001181 [Rhodosporidiobolus ruineniae]